MKLLIVRHGQTIENLQRICQGQTHGTLSAQGRDEARKIAQRLVDFDVDVCYTSDLRRATDTAACICAQHPDLEMREDSRLRERYFGLFQGRIFPEPPAAFPPNDEVETPEAIAVRLTVFLDEIRRNHSNQTVLIVSHGYTIRVLMTLLLRLPAADTETVADVKNASLTIADFYNGMYNVGLFNDTAHLF